MWLFTRHGFFSATTSPVKKGHIQLRSRTRSDLRKLIAAFPEQLKQARIIETPAADYRWRIVMTPSKWTVLAMKLAEDIDYGNFKNAAKANGIDTGPHHQVWSIMMREQSKERDRERAAWREEALPGLGDWAPPEEEPWEDPDGRIPAYGGERDADALHDLMMAGEETGEEESPNDGQCPDCRVPFMTDIAAGEQEGEASEGFCPDCGLTVEHFNMVAEQRRAAR